MTGLEPIGYIAAAKAGLAALGLYLAWSSTALYPYYEQTPRIWGLSPVEDQNIGGRADDGRAVVHARAGDGGAVRPGPHQE